MRHEHFEAVIARGRARPNLAVHDTNAPLNPDKTLFRGQYVVLHDLGPDELGDERYTTAQLATSAVTMRYVARCVGEDPAAARRIADVVRAQFVRWTPVVAGRVCRPVELDQEGELMQDKDTTPPLSYTDIDLTFRSLPEG